jgi:hypothetical protein
MVERKLDVSRRVTHGLEGGRVGRAEKGWKKVHTTIQARNMNEGE